MKKRNGQIIVTALIVCLMSGCTMKGCSMKGCGSGSSDPAVTPEVTVTETPFVTPTNTPVDVPGMTPTNTPTDVPGMTPTNTPTDVPGATPTNTPTGVPSLTPSNTPTGIPEVSITPVPTEKPGETPTVTPMGNPSATPIVTPTGEPSMIPAVTPTGEPSETPIATPTGKPSTIPTVIPTREPSATPAVIPTDSPGGTPGILPTNKPEATPTVAPTATMTPVASKTPSSTPTVAPTQIPEVTPVASETIKLDYREYESEKTTLANRGDRQSWYEVLTEGVYYEFDGSAAGKVKPGDTVYIWGEALVQNGADIIEYNYTKIPRIGLPEEMCSVYVIIVDYRKYYLEQRTVVSILNMFTDEEMFGSDFARYNYWTTYWYDEKGVQHEARINVKNTDGIGGNTCFITSTTITECYATRIVGEFARRVIYRDKTDPAEVIGTVWGQTVKFSPNTLLWIDRDMDGIFEYELTTDILYTYPAW